MTKTFPSGAIGGWAGVDKNLERFHRHSYMKMKRTPWFGGTRMGKHRYHRSGSGSGGGGGGVASIRVFFIALLFFLGTSFALSILFRAGWLASPFGPLSTDVDSFDSITLVSFHEINYLSFRFSHWLPLFGFEPKIHNHVNMCSIYVTGFLPFYRIMRT